MRRKLSVIAFPVKKWEKTRRVLGKSSVRSVKGAVIFPGFVIVMVSLPNRSEPIISGGRLLAKTSVGVSEPAMRVETFAQGVSNESSSEALGILIVIQNFSMFAGFLRPFQPVPVVVQLMAVMILVVMMVLHHIVDNLLVCGAGMEGHDFHSS